MSVVVEVSDLQGVLADLDPAAFICTVDSGGGIKVMHVLVTAGADGLTTTVGRGTAANIEAGSGVTLIFAGDTPQAMSLLVDAQADVGSGEPPTLHLRPSGAVWHRSAHGAGQ